MPAPAEYLVVPFGYWEQVPADRMLTCGRIKFCTEQQLIGIARFDSKAFALGLALISKHPLIREIQYSPTNWQYQLLLSLKENQ